MNTWKSPPRLHTKVDQVSVEPTAEVQEGFIYLVLLNASETQTRELEERPRDDSPKKKVPVVNREISLFLSQYCV